MRRISARSLAFGLIILALIAGALVFGRDSRADIDLSPRVKKPALMLLTTLPLVFPEEFSLAGGGSKALTSLETRYRVVPISATDGNSLRQGRLLLMAHALPQTAEALVDLDRWVRGGGRVLLLADPKLDWPSARPLGDKLRPPPSFADTGLLAHWGLKLAKSETDGPVSAEVGPNFIIFSSPGELQAQGKCDLEAKGIVARCDIGRGRVTVIADADWLNVDDRSKEQGQDEHFGLLLREIALLER